MIQGDGNKVYRNFYYDFEFYLTKKEFFIDKLGALSGTGKIKNIDTFDSTFFRAHPKLAQVMDTMTKICLERSIEAIIDAGLSPADLHGTNTGVFLGSAISEMEFKALNSDSFLGFVMLGNSKPMQANRLSFILNLTGRKLFK